MEVKINAEPLNKAEDKKEYGKFDEWQVKCAVDDLIRAEEIKKNPELMQYVKPLLEKKLTGVKQAITSIKGLRVKAANITEDDASGEE
jgi:hypothetical protein